jgi:hypothetical protein
MSYVFFLWVVVQNNCFIFDIKREAEQENLLLSGFFPAVTEKSGIEISCTKEYKLVNSWANFSTQRKEIWNEYFSYILYTIQYTMSFIRYIINCQL